jgi:hypothetical protein
VRALLRGAEYYTYRFRDGGVPVHRFTDYHMPSGVLSLLDGLVWVGDLKLRPEIAQELSSLVRESLTLAVHVSSAPLLPAHVLEREVKVLVRGPSDRTSAS